MIKEKKKSETCAPVIRIAAVNKKRVTEVVNVNTFVTANINARISTDRLFRKIDDISKTKRPLSFSVQANPRDLPFEI